MVLWCDHEMYQSNHLRYHHWNKVANVVKKSEIQSDLIHKTFSITAAAYFDSIFFQRTLKHCDSFRFVQNVDRKNELRVRTALFACAEETHLAGPKLYLDFQSRVNHLMSKDSSLRPPQAAIFCHKTQLTEEDIQTSIKQLAAEQGLSEILGESNADKADNQII